MGDQRESDVVPHQREVEEVVEKVLQSGANGVTGPGDVIYVARSTLLAVAASSVTNLAGFTDDYVLTTPGESHIDLVVNMTTGIVTVAHDGLYFVCANATYTGTPASKAALQIGHPDFPSDRFQTIVGSTPFSAVDDYFVNVYGVGRFLAGDQINAQIGVNSADTFSVTYCELSVRRIA